ncbi:MAG TPA: class I SAM-dependent methyltransferase [Patescibacteria group bacterium]|nr:class I SAM-dependent methyltransferase [Patescibacteria group bacterium]
MDQQERGYALLDAGDRRRLERFGELVLDRPAPAAADARRRSPGAWAAVDARYERGTGARSGRWVPADGLPAVWTTTFEGLAMELRPTPAGQVGLFPEHAAVARWAAGEAEAIGRARGRPATVLNLFAYTGLASLVLARAGARVVHVDASRPAVAWARRNAALAGLADRPVRWLVEDATRFVAREARREQRYDGVILDPPTYGHGPGGGAWRLAEDLEPLLAAIRQLLALEQWFVACTAHATAMLPDQLAGIVEQALGRSAGAPRVVELALRAESGARLAAGWAVLATSIQSPALP